MNMKKLIIYAMASGFLFTSCQKEDESGPSTQSGQKPAPTINVGPVPTNFIKKVMIEEFTSTANAQSPESADKISTLIKGNTNRIYHASLHSMDVMAGLQTNRLLTAFTPAAAGLPCASIDRNVFGGNIYLNPSQYKTSLNSMLAKPAICGLAIRSSTNGSNGYIDVYTGFSSTVTGSYKATTYLIEDVVVNGSPDFFQWNASNTNPASAYYNAGNPIIGFQHKNVLRKVISQDMGDIISPSSLIAGGTSVLSYEIDLPKKLGSNSTWKIISFITDATTNEVLNVQMSTLGTLKDWN